MTNENTTEKPNTLKEDIALLDEIWEAQGKLNIAVGIDTLAIFNSHEGNPSKTDLLRDYFDEAANEIFECKENIVHKWWVKEVKENKDYRFTIRDIAKVKLELIDVLHFLTSAAHINRFYYPDMLPEFNTRNQRTVFNSRQFYYILNSIIKNCILGETAYAFTNLFAAFKHLKMSVKEIHAIYMKKNEANLKRQENNYSMASKTEDDNEAIEAEIRQPDQVKTKPAKKKK